VRCGRGVGARSRATATATATATANPPWPPFPKGGTAGFLGGSLGRAKGASCAASRKLRVTSHAPTHRRQPPDATAVIRCDRDSSPPLKRGLRLAWRACRRGLLARGICFGSRRSLEQEQIPRPPFPKGGIAEAEAGCCRNFDDQKNRLSAVFLLQRRPGGLSLFPSPESRVPSPESRVPSPESRVPSPESRVPSPESRVPSPASRVPRPASRVPSPESRESPQKLMNNPPLTGMLAPVMKPASSAVRNSTVRAISLGLPRRPTGTLSTMRLRMSSGTAMTIAVSQ
jgi:hypothetical protein